MQHINLSSEVFSSIYVDNIAQRCQQTTKIWPLWNVVAVFRACSGVVVIPQVHRYLHWQNLSNAIWWSRNMPTVNFNVWNFRLNLPLADFERVIGTHFENLLVEQLWWIVWLLHDRLPKWDRKRNIDPPICFSIINRFSCVKRISLPPVSCWLQLRSTGHCW